MHTESDCQACGRGPAKPGYLVVERAYWYPDEPEFVTNVGRWPETAGAAPGTQMLGAARTAVASPRLRLAISPATNAMAVEQFCDALAARPAVHGVELEQFVGAMAVLQVDAIGLPAIVAALFELDGYPMVGLTVSGDGQISLRLEDHALARPTRPAIQPPLASAPPAATSQISALQERIARVSRDLGSLSAGNAATRPAAEAVAVQPYVAPVAQQPVIDYAPAEPDWQPESATPATPAPAPVGMHIVQALDRLAALRQGATAGAETEPPASAENEAQPDEQAYIQADPPADPRADEQVDEQAHEQNDTVVIDAEPENEHATIFAAPLARDRAPMPFPRLAAPEDGEEADAADVAEDQPTLSEPPAWRGMEVAAVALAPQSNVPGTPQSLQLIAYPFENFSGVNSFINAVRLLPDVRYVAPRRFRAGTIQLAVDYAGVEPLAERIRSLDSFMPRIVSEDEESVTVTIGHAS
jgi:hypothetical protein